MSGAKYAGSWRDITSIQYKSGLWSEHVELYGKTENEWHLIDLGAEQLGPAYHTWVIYAVDPYASTFDGKGVSTITLGTSYVGIRTGNRTNAPVIGVDIVDNADLVGFEWSTLQGDDAILVTVTSDNGYAFKNNLGAAKTITANVFIGGAESADYAGYLYTWTVNNLPVYATTAGTYTGTEQAFQTHLADGNDLSGVNLRSIEITASDVAAGVNFNLNCVVSNI